MSDLRNSLFIVFVALILGGLVLPLSEASFAEENNSAQCIKSCDDNLRVCRNRHSDRRRCKVQFQKCTEACHQNKQDSASEETPRVPENNKPELR